MLRHVIALNCSRAPFAKSHNGFDGAHLTRLLECSLAHGADYADLFFEYTEYAALVLEEGLVRQATSGVHLGLGVRACVGESTGFAHTEELTWESMKRAAETAARIAKAGGAGIASQLVERELPHRYPVVRASIDEAHMHKRRLLARAHDAAFACDPRVVRVETSLVEQVREVMILTSDGGWASDSQPMLRFHIRAVLEDGSRREAGRSGGGGRLGLEYFDQHPVSAHAAEAVRQATVLLEAKPAPAGQLEVVLGPGDSGILLHEAIGHGLEADFNRRGTSNYSGRLGQMVASPLCTVVDDPGLLHGRGSINVDDEACSAERTVLIEEGRLRGYLHDRMSAHHFGVPATGNGRRESYSSVTLPRMTNTLLLAGPHAPEEIIGSVKRGIFARAFGGGQVDIANGDFVFNLTESYLIEDGKITTPLKGVNLIGNGPETLSGVTMLGSDLVVSDGIWTCGKAGQSVPVGVACPTIKLSRITVGGTQIG